MVDRSFGHDEKVIRPLPLKSEERRAAPTSIAKLPGGETVVLAGNTLLAYKRDGKPARSFGGGAVQVSAPISGSLQLVDIAGDERGRVVVGGTASFPLDRSQWGVGEDRSIFLARYTRDGSLDPTFGEGGVLLTDPGAVSPPVDNYPGQPTDSPPLSQLSGLAIDSTGRIVLSGLRVSRVSACRGTPFVWHWDAFAARLREDGGLDSSFGQGGTVALSEDLGAAPPALTRSGGVYLWASDDNGCFTLYSHLARFGSNGQPVSSFGEGGTLHLESGTRENALAVDPRGRIVVLNSFGELLVKPEPGAPGGDFASVLRLLPNGKPDRSFGKGGEATLAAPFPDSVVAAPALAVDRLSRIVLVGSSQSVKGEAGGPRSFFVERLTARGAADRNFGTRGHMQIRFGQHSEAQASSVALVPRGRILVTGTFTRPSPSDGEGRALVRLTAH